MPAAELRDGWSIAEEVGRALTYYADPEGKRWLKVLKLLDIDAASMKELGIERDSDLPAAASWTWGEIDSESGPHIGERALKSVIQAGGLTRDLTEEAKSLIQLLCIYGLRTHWERKDYMVDPGFIWLPKPGTPLAILGPNLARHHLGMEPW